MNCICPILQLLWEFTNTSIKNNEQFGMLHVSLMTDLFYICIKVINENIINGKLHILMMVPLALLRAGFWLVISIILEDWRLWFFTWRNALSLQLHKCHCSSIIALLDWSPLGRPMGNCTWTKRVEDLEQTCNIASSTELCICCSSSIEQYALLKWHIQGIFT